MWPPNQQPYPPRPPPRAAPIPGCLIALIIVGGLGAVGLGTCVAVISLGGPSKEELRRAQQRVDEESDAAAQQNAAVTRELAKKCKAEHVTLKAREDFRDECRSLVNASLTVPGSASYPNEGTFTSRGPDFCVQFYRANVDAKNAFGVTVRTPFKCEYDPRIGLTTLANPD